MSNINNLVVLDLFCGCGGLSNGFEKAGYYIKYGIDNWKDALATFKNNHNNSIAINEDLSIENSEVIIKKYGFNDVDIIIGGPPCQGYSIAGKRQLDDERNVYYKSFLKFVEILNPKIFLMENVPNILSMGGGVVKENIKNDFDKINFNVVTEKLLASDYGVPQNRYRAFFVGLRNQDEFQFPQKLGLEKVSVEKAISDLPDENLINGHKYICRPMSKYQKYIRNDSAGIYNHQLTNHAKKTSEIISMVPDGGNYKDLPKDLWSTRKVNIAWTRLNSKLPSFTIDTGHRHHFHYKFNRVPTVRESARIQAFSDKFIFHGSKTSQYKQVGNAVPPLLAKELAKSMKHYI